MFWNKLIQPEVTISGIKGITASSVLYRQWATSPHLYIQELEAGQVHLLEFL